MYDSSLWRHQFLVQKRSPKIVWKDSLLRWTFFSKTDFSFMNLPKFCILAVVVEYLQTIRSQEICHTIEILSTTLPKSHKIFLATFFAEITQNDVLYSSCAISDPRKLISKTNFKKLKMRRRVPILSTHTLFWRWELTESENRTCCYFSTMWRRYRVIFDGFMGK